MTLYYSASTGGFYDSEIHGINVPADSVVITASVYRSLMDAQSQGSTIKADASGNPIAVAPPVPTLDQTKAALCADVDATADAVYVVIGGPSPGRLAEYRQAKDDATAFKADGYTGTVPSTVACWAQAQNWTAQQAADDILSTATAWENALSAIRSARLLGKASVNAAADADAANAAAATAIANVKAAAAQA